MGSDVSTQKRWGGEEFLKRELFAPASKMPHSWLQPWAIVVSGRWLGTAWSQQVDLHLSPLLRDSGQIAYWYILGCWVHREEVGAGTAIPSPWLGVRAFSSQCLLSFYFLI